MLASTKYGTYTPRAPHSVPQCLSPRPNWDPLPPALPQASVSPPGTKGEGYTLTCGRGVGGPNSDNLKKKPSTLFILCSPLFLMLKFKAKTTFKNGAIFSGCGSRLMRRKMPASTKKRMPSIRAKRRMTQRTIRGLHQRYSRRSSNLPLL
jgi:hypothetical protein